MQSIEQVFSGTTDFGGFMESTIARNGDLMYRTYLVVTLPEINCCWDGTDPNGTDVYNGQYKGNIHVLGIGVTKLF